MIYDASSAALIALQITSFGCCAQFLCANMLAGVCARAHTHAHMAGNIQWALQRCFFLLAFWVLPVTPPTTGSVVSTSVFLAQMQFIMVSESLRSLAADAWVAVTSFTIRSIVSRDARRILEVIAAAMDSVHVLHR